MSCDICHNVRHCSQIAIGISSGNTHGFEFGLDFGIGKLAVCLTQSRTSKRSANTHICQNTQCPGYIGDAVFGCRRLRSSHFQSLGKVCQRLCRAVGSCCKDVCNFCHPGRFNTKYTHIVCRDFGGFSQISPGGTGKVQYSRNRIFDFFRLEPHPPQSRHCFSNLFCRKRCFTPQFFSNCGQRLELFFRCSGNTFDQTHLIIKTGKSFCCISKWSCGKSCHSYHTFSGRGERISEISYFSLCRFQATLKFCLVKHQLYKGFTGSYITTCPCHGSPSFPVLSAFVSFQQRISVFSVFPCRNAADMD